MQLTKINGNTYYIPAPTNIGVFQFKDKYTLLIDSGDNKQQGRKIDETLQANHLSVKYIINTHNHIDHCGGNPYFQEHYPGSQVYASPQEKLFIEHGELFPTYLYGGHPIKELSRYFPANSYPLQEIFPGGVNKINEEKFEIISLPGHSQAQIGVGTRDRVCFLGDALFSQENIQKYSLPFLFDIADQFTTFDSITRLDYDFFVLGHSGSIYDAMAIQELTQLNKANLEHYLELSLDLLIQPKTREELLEEIAILADLQLDFKAYYFSLSTAAAIVSYLYSLDYLNYQLENGKLYYFRK